MNRVMVTGHRPKTIGPGKTKWIENTFRTLLTNIQAVHPYIEVISGMVLGADQIFTKVALDLKIPLLAYVPFQGQECVWSPPMQQEYHRLLSQAKHVLVVSEGPYSAEKMFIRNNEMVNNADLVIAVWNGIKKGGTFYTVKRAMDKHRPVIQMNPWSSQCTLLGPHQGDICSFLPS